MKETNGLEISQQRLRGHFLLFMDVDDEFEVIPARCHCVETKTRLSVLGNKQIYHSRGSELGIEKIIAHRAVTAVRES